MWCVVCDISKLMLSGDVVLGCLKVSGMNSFKRVKDFYFYVCLRFKTECWKVENIHF